MSVHEPTISYLKGRFTDYYRTADLNDAVPDPFYREWGYIPWSGGMRRHLSIEDLAELGETRAEFLAMAEPRHAYVSAATYDDPRQDGMMAKGWRGCDLVFDIDADHCPGVDGSMPHDMQLSIAKQHVLNLVDFLDRDFGFDGLDIVFSGGRGYHVHVRDDSVQELPSEVRTSVAGYVSGAGLNMSELIETRTDGPAVNRYLTSKGGWGKLLHDRLLDVCADVDRFESDADALDWLQTFDGIGEKRAETVLGALRHHRDAFDDGNVEAGGPGLRLLCESLLSSTIETRGAVVDEPVTGDTHRLMRLPGSLHGGTGLRACAVAREDLGSFDPFCDAVPERFTTSDIWIETDDHHAVSYDGDECVVEPGASCVPEAVGIYLMARGDAVKADER